ncbi:MAG: MAPEG family protein [Pseudomarimonas sp.]
MLSISPLYVALGGLLLLVLTIRVIVHRRDKKIGIGDGGDHLLLRKVRAHGNAVETLPIGLLMLVSLELSGGGAVLLHGLGAALIVGRALHAWGLSGSAGVSFGRMVGMLLTMLSFIGLIGCLLWRFAAAS